MALRDLMNRIEKKIFSLDEEGLLMKMSDKELKDAVTSEMEGKKEEERTFIGCLDEFVGTKTNKSTITVYTTTRNKILSFDPGCTFSSIDRSWLGNFLHRMGIALKQIGGMERTGRGGKKVREPLFPELSSYWSRHTWATLAAGLEIPKETISEALGHSIGSEVTSIYIKFDRKKVDAANRKVIVYVNGKGG